MPGAQPQLQALQGALLLGRHEGEGPCLVWAPGVGAAHGFVVRPPSAAAPGSAAALEAPDEGSPKTSEAPRGTRGAHRPSPCRRPQGPALTLLTASPQAHHEVCPRFPLTCDGCGKKKLARERVSCARPRGRPGGGRRAACVGGHPRFSSLPGTRTAKAGRTGPEGQGGAAAVREQEPQLLRGRTAPWLGSPLAPRRAALSWGHGHGHGGLLGRPCCPRARAFPSIEGLVVAQTTPWLQSET